ncbi:hypothetical protein BZA05DRAFT_142055 [Tricharina praecox]|uniref:uncharacterized protein n=1 Tax=Tricharina praecox TaxID=43433 RepID=UPI00221F26FE|nr:uncharacterized protein BZA05DRAFT_142055 [Tricharina praecox]KAI5845912.1 hypothetical protein BZA05DRAFT_142055 [Tricharina praecox]
MTANLSIYLWDSRDVRRNPGSRLAPGMVIECLHIHRRALSDGPEVQRDIRPWPMVIIGWRCNAVLFRIYFLRWKGLPGNYVFACLYVPCTCPSTGQWSIIGSSTMPTCDTQMSMPMSASMGLGWGWGWGWGWGSGVLVVSAPMFAVRGHHRDATTSTMVGHS